MSGPAVEYFYSAVIREGFYRRREDLRFYIDTFFRDVQLENSKVLDIGGGSGLYSFYAAAMGAAKVICLEPEGDGSRRDVNRKFQILRSARIVPDDAVLLVPSSLTSFQLPGERFDIVLLRNSINHLDEEACVRLMTDERSRATYLRLFSRIASLSAPAAKLIVRDCSSHNLFAHLGIRNPYAPTIEWHKHHPPEVWLDLFREVGFHNPQIWWPPHRDSSLLKKPLFGNRFLSYFLTSHFCFTMEKS